MPPPPQPPGIPGGKLPPRPEARHPGAEADTLPPEEPTRNDLPRARQRERQLTKPGMAAPPPAGLSRAATLQKTPSFLETAPESAGETALGDTTLQSAPPPPPARRQTLPGNGPPPRLEPVSVAPTRPQAPPRSMSPVPESIGHVSLPEGSKVSRKTLRALWVVIGPVVITAAGTAYGYVKGYAKGLLDGHDEIVRMRQQIQLEHDHGLKLETRLTSVEAELATEEQSSRTERATRDRAAKQLAEELEAVKRGLPRIQGLAKPER